LLRANSVVASDLSLAVVLRRLTSSAQDLVGARHAVLGVVGRNGALDQFIHVDMDPDMAGQIRELAVGLGVLGEPIRHPKPLGLTDVPDHPASSELPALLEHPPIGGLLAVPIRVRNRLFGNLY
jgi:GAF domain-containing protein